MDFQLALGAAPSDISDMSNGATFADRVRERLADLGTNPFAVADKAKFERNFVNDIVIGRKKSVRSDSLIRLAEVLETTAEWLSCRPGAEKERRQTSPALFDVGTAIRDARRQSGVVIRQIAELLQLDVETLTAVEAGSTNLTREQVEKVADFLNVERAALLSGEVQPLGNVSLGDAMFISDAQRPFAGPRDVEKLGVVAAGDDGDFEFNGEVADYVARPRGLIGKPGVFALEVISESMYPAYRKSDIIFCDRSEPVVGDDVVIETFPEGHSKNGKSFIKRLKRRTQKAVIVEQFNPAQELNFDPYAIKRVWRVVPNRELHGY